MPQHSVSNVNQNNNNPGALVLACVDVTGGGNDVALYFNPTYCKILTPQWGCFQHVNLSVEGGIHTFQYSSNESLSLDILFADLPTFNSTDDPREMPLQAAGNVPLAGYVDLLSYIQMTLNYSQSSTVIYFPTGQIEPACVYLGGIESFSEAEGNQNNRAQRANRWGGSLRFVRRLPWVYN